jgi:hypothetical protein
VIYLVESNDERLRWHDGESRGVLADRYPHELYLHLIDLADDEMRGLKLLPGVLRHGPANGQWWIPDRPAKACWPGIQNPQLKSRRRTLGEMLAARRH